MRPLALLFHKCAILALVFGLFIPSLANAQSPKETDLLPVFDGKHWGFIDGSGNVVIPFQFDIAEPFSEGLAVVRSGHKLGYIDGRGKWVLKTKYDLAQSFSDGLAAVGRSSKSAWKWAYIDKQGKVVIPFRFYDASSFSDGLARVGILEKGTRFGYIDKEGKFVISPTLRDAKPFSEGLAAAHFKEGVGYFDKTGALAISPHPYGFGGSFSEGLALVSRGSTYGYIDKTGQVVIDFKFTEARDFHEGRARVFYLGGYGFINKKGEFVINPRYTDASDFSDGVAAVSELGAQSGVIDTNGNLLASYPLSRAELAGRGVFLIQHSVFGWLGYMNRNGTVIYKMPPDAVCSSCFKLAPLTPEKRETITFESDPSHAWVYLIDTAAYEEDFSVVSNDKKLANYLCAKNPTTVECDALPNSYVAVFALNGRKCVLRNVVIRKGETHKYSFPFNNPPPGACP